MENKKYRIVETMYAKGKMISKFASCENCSYEEAVWMVSEMRAAFGPETNATTGVTTIITIEEMEKEFKSFI